MTMPAEDTGNRKAQTTPPSSQSMPVEFIGGKVLGRIRKNRTALFNQIRKRTFGALKPQNIDEAERMDRYAWRCVLYEVILDERAIQADPARRHELTIALTNLLLSMDNVMAKGEVPLPGGDLDNGRASYLMHGQPQKDGRMPRTATDPAHHALMKAGRERSARERLIAAKQAQEQAAADAAAVAAAAAEPSEQARKAKEATQP